MGLVKGLEFLRNHIDSEREGLCNAWIKQDISGPNLKISKFILSFLLENLQCLEELSYFPHDGYVDL